MTRQEGQKGQALIFALIFLAVGGLMIVPVLTYTTTGLHSQRISEEYLSDQDAADAAVMDAIWRILEQGALTQIDPETGTYAYDFELGLERWGVTIEIPSVGGSDWQTIKGNNRCKIEVFPNWLEAQGEETFYYVVRLDMVQWDLTEFSFRLPMGLGYDAGTAVSAGPESQSRIEPDADIDHVNSLYYRQKQPKDWQPMEARFEEVDQMPDPLVESTWYLLKEWENGHHKLTWKPDFGATGNDTFFLVFQATGTLDWGIHYILPEFTDGVEVIPLEPTAGIASAMYNIIIDAGEQTISAVIGITPEGEIKLVSYQVVT